jgi:hypothetical protein
MYFESDERSMPTFGKYERLKNLRFRKRGSSNRAFVLMGAFIIVISIIFFALSFPKTKDLYLVTFFFAFAGIGALFIYFGIVGKKQTEN